MPDKIKIAIIGMGNVATTLLKGFEFYKNSTDGLWHPTLAGLTLNDFTLSSVYDIDSSKVGKKIGQILTNSKSDFSDLVIQSGLMEDSTPSHIAQKGQIKTTNYDGFVKSLKDTKPEFLINLISSGMEKSSEKYAKAALDAGCSFFIATSAKTANENSQKAFESKG